jgi:hypothetical protein
MTTRYLICGGRTFIDAAMMDSCLSNLILAPRNAVIIHGDAPGADKLAGQWGFAHGAIVEAYPADWAVHGKAAGAIRNRRMLDLGKPDVVIAFPGGPGTANMVRQAREKDVVVIEVTV